MLEKWMQRETIQSGWLDDLGLTGRKLHVWCDLIGVTQKKRVAGTWRRFSPLQVLHFSTLTVLKCHTGVAISQGNLLSDFVTGNVFATRSLELWKEGKRPILCTDFAKTASIEEADTVSIATRNADARIRAFLDIERDIAFMMRAAHQGGDDDQRHRLALLFAQRSEALRTRGRRQLDLGPSTAPAADEEIEEYIQQTLVVTA